MNATQMIEALKLYSVAFRTATKLLADQTGEDPAVVRSQILQEAHGILPEICLSSLTSTMHHDLETSKQLSDRSSL